MAISKFIIIFCLFLAGQAQADEWSLQINGTSIHQGECRVKCNEDNRGLGIQSEWLTESGDIQLFTAGTLINSLNDCSYYIGGAWQYKAGPVGMGAFYGMVYYPSDRANWWPALLPMASLNFKHFGINAIYIPAVRDDVVPALLFQLVARLP